jgi:hypothetical protein
MYLHPIYFSTQYTFPSSPYKTPLRMNRSSLQSLAHLQNIAHSTETLPIIQLWVFFGDPSHIIFNIEEFINPVQVGVEESKFDKPTSKDVGKHLQALGFSVWLNMVIIFLYVGKAMSDKVAGWKQYTELSQCTRNLTQEKECY